MGYLQNVEPRKRDKRADLGIVRYR